MPQLTFLFRISFFNTLSLINFTSAFKMPLRHLYAGLFCSKEATDR